MLTAEEAKYAHDVAISSGDCPWEAVAEIARYSPKVYTAVADSWDGKDGPLCVFACTDLSEMQKYFNDPGEMLCLSDSKTLELTTWDWSGCHEGGIDGFDLTVLNLVKRVAELEGIVETRNDTEKQQGE